MDQGSSSAVSEAQFSPPHDLLVYAGLAAMEGCHSRAYGASGGGWMRPDGSPSPGCRVDDCIYTDSLPTDLLYCADVEPVPVPCVLDRVVLSFLCPRHPLPAGRIAGCHGERTRNGRHSTRQGTMSLAAWLITSI